MDLACEDRLADSSFGELVWRSQSQSSDPFISMAEVSAGYFDQAHLIKSLKHFVGLTPGLIIDNSRLEKLSFLYNTAPLLLNYDADGWVTKEGEHA